MRAPDRLQDRGIILRTGHLPPLRAFGDAMAEQLEVAFVSAVMTALIALAKASFVVRMRDRNSLHNGEATLLESSEGWGAPDCEREMFRSCRRLRQII